MDRYGFNSKLYGKFSWNVPGLMEDVSNNLNESDTKSWYNNIINDLYY